MKDSIKTIEKTPSGSLYKVQDSDSPVQALLFSSPQTRAIVNDPLVYGTEYLVTLRQAMSRLFELMSEQDLLLAEEERTMILHVLRGGLNFGLIEALYKSLGWKSPRSAFISSQRVFDDENGWHITENRYQKIYIPEQMDLILGDVVATGVSLEHALRKTIERTEVEGKQLRSITFITIGGKRAQEILERIDLICREKFPAYRGAQVIFIEGVFAVAEEESSLQIALAGTDLLRNPALLAPELLDSQLDAPSYALERCAIYDAGSRAFHVEEYLEDVQDYWKQVLELAEGGLSYADYFKERLPELADRVEGSSTSLAEVANKQLEQLQD